MKSCCFCGVSKGVTVHHIIPYFLRRHFPPSHNVNDGGCVLLCEKHHKLAERESRKIYDPIVKFHQADYFQYEALHANNAIRRLIKIKSGTFVSTNPIINQLLRDSLVYTSLDEVPSEIQESAFFDEKLIKKTVAQQVAIRWIWHHDGIANVRLIFKEALEKARKIFLDEKTK